MSDPANITQLLNQWSGGDDKAGEQLTPIVYEELRRLARRIFSGERQGHTLQPTALVHEAYVKLIDADVTWQDRAHFYSLAARMMRRLLVNNANARGAEKRGGKAVRVTLVEDNVAGPSEEAGILALNEALESLAQIDERKSHLIELQYFGGLSQKEMEVVTGLSRSTIVRDLRLARAWVKSFLDKH